MSSIDEGYMCIWREMRQVSRVNKLNLIESAMIKYKIREMLDAKFFFYFYHIFVCTLFDFFCVLDMRGVGVVCCSLSDFLISIF